jgi:hypothetical protein
LEQLDQITNLSRKRAGAPGHKWGSEFPQLFGPAQILERIFIGPREWHC